MGTVLTARRALCLFLAAAACGLAAAVPNPVLPGTADCGVMRFAGKYYLMGVGTNGGVYVSDDLVTWEGPFPAIEMDNAWATGPAGAPSEIHACDLRLHNGFFHLYWSVNHGELRQIGHAVANDPLGPYLEPVTDRPFDGRIDPNLFLDEDGRLYFYTTKFTDGNVLWGQEMSDPWTHLGEPVPLMSAVPRTWEMRDHKVNEAQDAITYRNTYYMLYNANHTSDRFGNYAIGAATADAPLAFRNEGKYPYPVLESNRRRVLGAGRAVVPVAVREATVWRFSTEAPPADWHAPGFDDAAWETGHGGFGARTGHPEHRSARTEWDTPELWLRHGFELERVPEHVRLLYFAGGAATVYVNGVEAASGGGMSGYASVPLSGAARAALRPGHNVVAVHARRTERGMPFVDAGLLDTGGHPGEPIVHNCGQPALVRGPNGFEWWVAYFALYNGSRARAQAVDRVHFFDRELFIDGPTTAETPGYHPPPAPPTFADAFDADGPPGEHWILRGGEWTVRNGHMQQSLDDGPASARCEGPGGAYFQFETSVRFPEQGGRQAGAASTELVFGLDREQNTWFYMPRFRNVSEERHFPLPENFNWTGWHTLRMACNGLRYRLWLDGAFAGETLGSGVLSSVRPELFARGPAQFDGVAYTIGWDGVGDLVDDWAAAYCGTAAQGHWTQRDGGLLGEPVPEDGTGEAQRSPLPLHFHEEAHVFKGDLLDAFEWTVQVVPAPGENDMPEARVGMYALYADEANFLRVAADHGFRRVEVSGMRGGESLAPRTAHVPRRERRAGPPGRDGYNLRVVKLAERVILFAEGCEILELPGAWPAAQAGLFTHGMACYFRGVTLFDRGGGG